MQRTCSTTSLASHKVQSFTQILLVIDTEYVLSEDEEEVQVVQQHQSDQMYSHFAGNDDDSLEAALGLGML